MAELLDVPIEDVVVIKHEGDSRADMWMEADGFRFLLESRSSGDAAPVTMALKQVQHRARQLRKKVIPLIVVPYMGDVGRKLCEEAGISWIDLSGNAHIVAKGFRVHIEGRPNRFKRPGRPSNVFAPKSARICRWLLLHPGEALTQREIAQATAMDEGFTSRIARKLEQDGFVVREESGAIRVANPDLLLDAWRESYAFTKHDIIRGHIAARSSEELLVTLAGKLIDRQVEYAATGLCGAWLLSRFAGFRTVTFYLREQPGDRMLRELVFRQEPRGANVWLVVPNDEGVFYGAIRHDRIQCVHPIQVYLDLKGHPERAKEASTELREQHLKWRRDD